MKLFITTALILFSGTSAFAAKHNCFDYHTDLEKLRAKEITASTLPIQTRVMRGFLYGAFNATRSIPSNELQDKEAQSFEEMVIKACKVHPNEKTAKIILNLIRKQPPNKPDLNSSKLTPETHPKKPTWSPEEAALMVAYIDWGTANCGEMPHPFLMAYIQSIRSGSNPELLKEATNHILERSKSAGVNKEQMCVEYVEKINKKPF